MRDINQNGSDACAEEIRALMTKIEIGSDDRLELHQKVGLLLVAAKKALKHGEFREWCDHEFGRGREWCSTHMRLAQNWDDFQAARDWARTKDLPSANCYSIDAALRLLHHWRSETVQSPKKPAAKKQTASEKIARLTRDMSAARDQYREVLEEARSFRVELPAGEASRVQNLIPALENEDADAEREIRSIAKDYRWLFRDLVADQKSGEPDFSKTQKVEADDADQAPLSDPLDENLSEARPSEAPADTPVQAVADAPTRSTRWAKAPNLKTRQASSGARGMLRRNDQLERQSEDRR